jgi:secreted trypsin-like serine protease
MPETGEKVICGIVSHGIGCGRKGYPGIYSNVSHFTEWIDTTIKQFT